ncbi:MAG: SRPBCC family protein [Gammaproteobacteria bacterium]|nr:SRPBCC family protein [Gammaproteobacteria bacterium]NIQ09080.1 SRPBCC family protein [Gammaproteobacteria bacterium]NIQ74098.1 SRPBCC family protein [Gammaproteobacteria bacterium]NIR26663.1 SRPBCC family protein [Gammaproteobacteria bacterium]NIR93434.1 SRPBCC family protein [Gammaproteobacteria bacterium]
MALLLMLLCHVQAAQAGEIQQVSITRQGPIYSISFLVVIEREISQVRSRLLDHARFHELSDMVVVSKHLRKNQTNLRQLEVRACLIFFCPEFVVRERIDLGPDGFTATVIPEQSDFYLGVSHWLLKPDKPGHTTLTFDSTLEPKFWIPPLIGPWFLEKRLTRELGVLVERVETDG